MQSLPAPYSFGKASRGEIFVDLRSAQTHLGLWMRQGSFCLAATLAVGLPNSARTDEVPCPTFELVETAAAEMTGATPPRQVLRWNRKGDQLQVEVQPSEGELVHRQVDVARLGCVEQGRAIALIWASVELGSPSLALPPPDLEPAMPAASFPPAPSLPPPAVGVRAKPPEGAIERRRLGFEGEVAGLASWAGQGAAAAVQLAAAARGQSGFGARMGLGFQGPMQENIGTGLGRWTRGQLAAGATRRMEGAGWVGDVEAAAVMSRLHVEGIHFDNNAKGTALDWGGRLGLRVSRQGGGVAPFVVLQADGWLGRQRLTVANLAEQGDVSRYTLSIGLGIGWISPP